MVLFFLTEIEKETQRQRDKSNVCIYNRKSPNRDTARERQRDKSNMCLCIRKSTARVYNYSSSLPVLAHCCLLHSFIVEESGGGGKFKEESPSAV